MMKTEIKTKDPIEQIETLASDLVRRLNQLMGGRAGDGISRPQYVLLSVLLEQGPLSLSALGSRIGSAQSSTSELAARMEKAGLVKKTRSPEDGRVVWLKITDQGRTLLRQCRKRPREVFHRLFAEAGVEARDAFLDSLEKLLAILDGKPATGPVGGDR
jgi:DNA-binding MarR family transcriptional regulator